MPRFAESFPRLDARALHRAGLLGPGASARLAWTDGATLTATVSDAGDVLMLTAGETGEAVSLDAHPNTKGGHRVWFGCPGCGRRCAVIYGASGPWRCRRCLNLTYRTVYSDPAARAVRRCQTIRARLGAADADWQTVPARPRYMHAATYARLVADLAGWQGRARALCLGTLEPPA